jgi:muramoyltetrapeptide carboxypeptidase
MKQLLLYFGLFFIHCYASAQNPFPMITPSYLQPGDTVAIVATARKHIDDDLEKTKKLLQDWGLHIKVGSSIGLDNHQLAGTDIERANDFQEQLNNPNVKAIWCVRGGYGTVRIIDLIDFSNIKSQPKWIVGFSDVTVLHSHLNAIGVQSIHGMMPVNIPRATTEAKESLYKALFGKPLQYEISGHPLNKTGKASGQIVGGNLSILYSLLGSPTAIDCSDKILFLEDLDEYLYHIDRMMMNLKRNGCLGQLKGMIIGGMTKMNDNAVPWGKNAEEIIAAITKDLNIPIAFGFPAGHLADNRALVLGKKVTLEVSPTQTQVIFEN